MSQAGAATQQFSSEGGQYLTFVLGDEEYGLDILRVQEIRGYSAITAIPNMPAHIRGVMNLRGAVVPVVDLRAKFGLPEIEYTKFTVIIVVNLGTRIIGLIVDAVSDVLKIAPDQVEPPPEMEGSAEGSFITGLGKAAEKFILLLDIERAVGTAEIATLGRAA